MKRRLATVLALAPLLTYAQQAVLTQHNDNFRTGTVLSEKKLNAANVKVGRFGKLFTRKVDGQLYAQPLYVPGLPVGSKTRNVVYCATMHDSVYAFDANDASATQPLWHRSFTNDTTVKTIPYWDLVGWTDISPEIGILATPVIDPATNTMYVVVRTLEGDENDDASYKQRLYALDIKTGVNKRDPVELQGSYPGNGDASNGQGQNIYNGRRENQRPAITLANGRLYIASASHGDTRPYHGWILAYDAATLSYLGAFNTTTNGGLGGIWMSGQGPAIDEQGNLYVVTGNGPFDPSIGNYGDTVLKLDKDLKVVDYFTPFNQANLEAWDADLGSSGAMLLPGTNVVVSGSKEGKIYLMDRSNMGKFHEGSDDNVHNWVQAAPAHIHGTPVFYDGPNGRHLYVWGEMDRLKEFGLSDDNMLSPNPVATGEVVAPDGMPGAFLSISADGKKDGTGVVWATLPLAGDANQNIVPGVLRAFDANTLQEIWNSRQNVANDDVGLFAKYSPPTVADGQVFLGTFSGELAVYGLLPARRPDVPADLTAQSGEGRVKLAWNTTPLATYFDVFRAPKGGTPKALKLGLNTNSFLDKSGDIGVLYDYSVRARNEYGASKLGNTVTAAAMAPLYTVSLPASGDAYVGSGSMSARNFGATNTVILDGNSLSTYRYGFFKFDLANLPKGEIAQAKLVLTGSRVGDTVSNDDLFSVRDDWSETSLTYDNMPKMQQYLGTTQVNNVSGPREWDVTAYLKSLQTGAATTASFGLAMEPRGKEEPDFYQGKRIVDTFFSRESKSNQPSLVISTRPIVSLPNGFVNASGAQLNGNAAVVGGRLRLVDSQNWQAGSAFWKSRLQVDRFKTKFRFQLSPVGGQDMADGITFVLQGNNANAIGGQGGDLGYTGIGKSVAVKFDLWDNMGEGRNSTGLYVNGNAPMTPATSFDGTGIDLHSGHVFEVAMSYDGTSLRVVTTDTQTGATASQSYAVDIPDILGKTIGFAGFTGATGGLNGQFDILNWTYGL